MPTSSSNMAVYETAHCRNEDVPINAMSLNKIMGLFITGTVLFRPKDLSSQRLSSHSMEGQVEPLDQGSVTSLYVLGQYYPAVASIFFKPFSYFRVLCYSLPLLSKHDSGQIAEPRIPTFQISGSKNLWF